MTDVEQRIVRLERAVRRWRWLGIAAAAVVAVGFLLGQDTPREATGFDAIACRQLTVIDDDHHARISLTCDPETDETLILATSNGGKRRFALRMDDQRAQLMLAAMEGDAVTAGQLVAIDLTETAARVRCGRPDAAGVTLAAKDRQASASVGTAQSQVLILEDEQESKTAILVRDQGGIDLIYPRRGESEDEGQDEGGEHD